MSSLALCARAGCTELVERGRCERCRRAQRQVVDQRRLSARERGYDATWERLRAAYLAAHPVCECDDRCGLPAVHVDHRDGRGPRGPRGHDPHNLRAMTAECHGRRTAADQPGGWNAPR